MATPLNQQKMIKVTFLPSSRQIEVPRGTSIYDAGISGGFPIRGDCGGKGLCGKCRVKLLGGSITPLSDAIKSHLAEEEISAGMTLACQSSLLEDSFVEIEEAQIAEDSKGDIGSSYRQLDVDSSLRKIYLIIPHPSLEDQASDLERVGREISDIVNINADLRTLSILPQILRKSDFSVTAILYGDSLLGIESGDTTPQKYGIAFDLGTTTVAGFLVDLNSGKTLVSSHTNNYQQIFGADVISRINYTIEHRTGTGLLQKRICLAMNDIICHLLKEAGLSKDQVYEVIAVGNTTMIHMMLGLNCEAIAKSPFVPVFRQPIEISNSDLGLNIYSNARISTLPNVSGFFGSDIIAAMLSVGMVGGTEVNLLIDLGTNGEIALSGRGEILATSTAAGPAFEGAAISCGMRAAKGAIRDIRISEDIDLDVIGDASPIGICGSGLVATIAEMLRSGLLLTDGRFAERVALEGRMSRAVLDRIRDCPNGKEFILANRDQRVPTRTVAITQLDVRQLQLAKAAICAGIRILMEEMNIEGNQISNVFLAGAFGNCLTRESAVSIGLVPDIPIDRIHAVGNAAGEGARMALCLGEARRRAIDLANTVKFVELAKHKDFRDVFLEATYFPMVSPGNPT